LEMIKMIHAGIRNIWMVGAAGSGKTTMGGIVAENIDVPCTIISCGLGTSSVEFLGYKYPTREATPFAGAFGQPSIIILDEFTALDPAVAQVCNSALANGQITTTTGVVQRHPDCVIIATSNTFGDGADRQYVANQQLDAATIDRFMGGIIEVGYSKEYEARFDIEIRTYVLALRKLIKQHSFRRVASTRMMIQGEALKNGAFPEWRNRLIINWSEEEKSVVTGNLGVAMNEAQREAQGSEM
jgi:MoxR-like ATPase